MQTEDHSNLSFLICWKCDHQALSVSPCLRALSSEAIGSNLVLKKQKERKEKMHQDPALALSLKSPTVDQGSTNLSHTRLVLALTFSTCTCV